ncbi:hypothetical protein B0E47_11205 [Rhodanobacter sp. B05]|nr:hypothetical protein B0E47_11205 [Rhodanobacter sp. B05]
MLPFPKCLDLLDDQGTYPSTAVQLLGLPSDAIGSLPVFSGHLHWLAGDSGTQAGFQPAFVFVIWNDTLTETLTVQLATPGFRSIVLILHGPDQAPPATLNGRPLAHFRFDGTPLDAVLSLIAPLVLPLIYRSVVCVALEDYEYLFARGGRLRCLGKTWGEDMDVCFAELAWQLGEAKSLAGCNDRLLTSILVPSSMCALSVADRVAAVVQRANGCGEPSWLISTLVHQEVTIRLCAYAVEPADKL